ncbi:hypothetical protein [Algoriphagus algorifonticola]|uniref:hypothetical protein n=1 Tax=Algoriphagus algorifonticola TaxID=2593007 RepID=UPI0011A38BC8|nr:hypothetical protein [Algoriphagus algorifonticola]
MRKFVPLLFFVTLVGCGTPTELKTVNWNGNRITWTVLDGGATTSYYWKIFFTKKGSNSQDLIFESYSSPYITDISTNGNKLLIHCAVDRDSTDIITIDLNKIEDFIDDPIEYERSLLEQTNESYIEPEFVKQDREFAIKHNLTN